MQRGYDMEVRWDGENLSENSLRASYLRMKIIECSMFSEWKNKSLKKKGLEIIYIYIYIYIIYGFTPFNFKQIYIVWGG